MPDARAKYVSPSVKLTAFCCPHCQVLTTQHWYQAHAEPLRGKLPFVISAEEAKERERHLSKIEEKGNREKAQRWLQHMVAQQPFLHATSASIDHYLYNIWISDCYDCKKLSIWLCDALLWPRQTTAPLMHPDLPEALIGDYQEASDILEFSPRGSAALLRLLIEKLCESLGEIEGKLDNKIASLVRKGLDPRAQKALDLVRVIGNNAVHPGQIDLIDDRPTAEKLFGLVNLIVDLTITQPKQLDEMFGKLPDGARKAIERRDGQKRD
jgi:hypothetical protein